MRMWPNGKALGFQPSFRRFDSCHPLQVLRRVVRVARYRSAKPVTSVQFTHAPPEFAPIAQTSKSGCLVNSGFSAEIRVGAPDVAEAKVDEARGCGPRHSRCKFGQPPQVGS